MAVTPTPCREAQQPLPDSGSSLFTLAQGHIASQGPKANSAPPPGSLHGLKAATQLVSFLCCKQKGFARQQKKKHLLDLARSGFPFQSLGWKARSSTEHMLPCPLGTTPGRGLKARHGLGTSQHCSTNWQVQETCLGPGICSPTWSSGSSVEFQNQALPARGATVVSTWYWDSGSRVSFPASPQELVVLKSWATAHRPAIPTGSPETAAR